MTDNAFGLQGKVALVTGSTKGIGNGIAMELAKAGADIIVTSRNKADCENVVGEIKKFGVRALAFAADVTKIDDINALLTAAINHFGRIDILVNNAGTAVTKKAEYLTEEDWDRVLNTNLKGVFFCTQAIGRHMIENKSGKIVNIASMLGIVGDKQVLPYCVAKGGVIQMTRALALEWARYNINVNALCPGYVMTQINEAEFKNEKIMSHVLGNIPLSRLGSIGDMARAAVFLASPASDYMTGQTLVIDGGWTAK